MEEIKHLSFDHYSVLNTLWRLTFRKGTRYSITIQELLSAFNSATPEYKDDPMTEKHMKDILKQLIADKYIVADLDKHAFLITICCIPFVVLKP